MRKVLRLPARLAAAAGRTGRRLIRLVSLAAAAGFILLVFDTLLLGNTRRGGPSRR